MKQDFINNNFTNQLFDATLRKFIEKQHKKKGITSKEHNKNLIRKSNIYNISWDEKKYILKQKTKCTDDYYKLNLIIHCKETKTKKCILKNS